jgi:hypothetical protein
MPMSNPLFCTVMKYLLLLPLVEQGLDILVDEFYFQFARGLPRWEHLGRPLDTFTVLAPILWQGFSLQSQGNLMVYVVPPHSRACSSSRMNSYIPMFALRPSTSMPCSSSCIHWFLPLLLLCHAPAGAIVWLEQVLGRASALPIQAAILALYMIYQAVYWNLIWKAPATEFEARQ